MSRAPSAVGPPARRQRTLLGFLKMSSLTRHSLEQIEVAAGTLAPEQTRNHQVWGPLALYSASPEALPKFGTFSELYQLYQLYALLASQITIYILTYLYVRVYKFNFLSYS